MAAPFRIVVRGRLSERFCRGLAGGVRRRVEGDRTVIEGVPGGRPAAEVLAALGNLGVEVVDADGIGDLGARRPGPSSRKEEESP